MDKLHITQTQWDEITASNTYCPAPFNSKYIDTDGSVKCCCVLQSYKSTHYTDPDSYNSAELKNLRKNIINKVPSDSCRRCYENESMGSRSYRQGMVESAINWNTDIKNNINADYSVDNPLIDYLDVRFDNVCNLRCRYCSSVFSSSWNNETELLSKEVKVFQFVRRRPVHQKILSSVDNIDNIKKDLETVKKIYFAGGEPLVNDNHYKVLEYLISVGKTDLEIIYNTNFSNIKQVLPYWKQFSNIYVGASLDANYKRGEYIRKNSVWDQIVKNRETMISEVPNIRFEISPTISIFNAYNVIDFHREWVEKELIGPFDFSAWSIVTKPEHYDIKNLPNHHKDNLKKLYLEQIDWLSSQTIKNYNFATNQNSDFAIQSYKGMLNRLSLSENIGYQKYWEIDKWLDNNRNESFADVFPEYRDFTDILDKY